MTGPPDQQDPAVAVASTAKSTNTKAGPTSPARSDKSSDSEGKPVRDKLKETRIDAQNAQDSASKADKAMHDAPNGSTAVGDQSASGSDSERGRLRRKRSREDFEKDNEVDKQPEKKQEHEKGERHHTRKRSRDIKDIESGPPIKNATNSVSRIEEDDIDEQMTSPSKATSKNSTSHADTSPKNKRTRDQAETVEQQTIENGDANGKHTSDAESERDPKRPRDEEIESSNAKTETKSKIPPGSGFANTSSASPFAAMAAKPQPSKTPDAAESLPQTSSEKFKASGFGSFASSTSSPFGGLKSPGSSSPFGAAAGGTKLSSFAGSKSSSESTGSGFGGLGNSTKSAFGNSTFGSALGGGFGSLAGSKPGHSSFATPADLTIKGLKSRPSAFGTPADQDKDDDSNDSDGGDDDDNDKDGNDEERKSSQPLLFQQPHETGEEGENTIWTGRAKLYMMAGEGTSKAWKERGVGTFKLNITIDQPRKARFVLRADGTHRLLLNAAVTKELKFGDSSGDKPKDGRLLFNSPTASGELEMYLMRLKSERAVELWEEVNKVKDTEL